MGISKSRLLWFSVVWTMSLLLVLADTRLTDPEEVTSLRAIRQSFVDPNKRLSNWNRGDPCLSNWTGVLCFNTTLDNGYLHVRELLLLNLNLSGTLSPEIKRLSHMQILDVMWNNIGGSIPKEIGQLTSLKFLLLNGNNLIGSLPEEIGNLPNLNRIQIDQNHISGPIPVHWANLNNTKHFHMNNNSLSGQIPPELSKLPNIVHLLLDNNNLSGYLPPELSIPPYLIILQFDNNHFEGGIPSSYGNMLQLAKLSLRNCTLRGPIPDLSRIPHLTYIDLSDNNLYGSIPNMNLSHNITTIDLSRNKLTGTIPLSFSGLPNLQKLSLSNNSLNGSVPSNIWQNRTFHSKFTVDLKNNRLSGFSGNLNLPQNVTLSLQGNPACTNASLAQFCESSRASVNHLQSVPSNSTQNCPPESCPSNFEYAPGSPVRCFCASPLLVGFRLKSPGFSYFEPYFYPFEVYLTSGLEINHFQLDLTYEWQTGPRLGMYLKLFPVYIGNGSNVFNRSEVLRLRSLFTQWEIPYDKFYGPYEIINFTLLDPYKNYFPTTSPSSGIRKGAVAGIAVGATVGAILVSAFVSLYIIRSHRNKYGAVSRRRRVSRASQKIEGVKSFTFEEMKHATNNFDVASEVGEGGYGKVYKGIFTDGTLVAIKRAEEGSLQGESEFLTEIELLSRLHHRNLVSLLGFCDEEGEQMLVYEFMAGGTLRDHLSEQFKESLTFAMRLKIALDSAKGILYLHTEANPPIFHRDIKASNILLDSRLTAKVADFGLSRLAPLPDISGVVHGHVSTTVKGTPGYLDPEYFLTHNLTDKSDVYSLGVVFLELLTGMQAITHGKNIVREVNTMYQSGNIFSVVDEKMGPYTSECVEKFVTLALRCCRDDPDGRPSMVEVVWELENICQMLKEFDSRRIDSVADTEPVSSPSSSLTKNMFLGFSDISDIDLSSGAFSTIIPR